MKVGSKKLSLCFFFPSKIDSLLISYTHFLRNFCLELDLSLNKSDEMDWLYPPKIRELTEMCFRESSF
jgi:hypothetical protein